MDRGLYVYRRRLIKVHVPVHDGRDAGSGSSSSNDDDEWTAASSHLDQRVCECECCVGAGTVCECMVDPSRLDQSAMVRSVSIDRISDRSLSREKPASWTVESTHRICRMVSWIC